MDAATHDAIINRAKVHWYALCRQLNSPAGSDDVLNDLLARYAEPHRAYHNIVHIVNMLDEWTNWDEGSLDLPLAIWFHDAIYDPRAKDNETQSGMLAMRQIMAMKLPFALARNTLCFILKTTHQGDTGDYYVNMLLDLDLMVFGRSEEEFDQYEIAIRKEYEWVPELTYATKRRDILKGFRDREFVYFTSPFRKRYEVAAKRNLQRSIDNLSLMTETLQQCQ